MSSPSLYYALTPGSSLNTSGILAAPAGYPVSSFIIRASGPLFKTGHLSPTPESCAQQCWEYAKGQCIAARYHVADAADAARKPNSTDPTAMCEAMRRPLYEGEHNQTFAVPVDLRDTYAFKYGDIVTGFGAFPWVPQAVNVAVDGPADSAPPPSLEALATACFDKCNQSPTCWVSTYVRANRTCRHYPMATDMDQAAPQVWVWPLGKNWTVLPKDVQANNLTELVDKARAQKGMPRPSSSGKVVVGKLLLLAPLLGMFIGHMSYV